MVIGSSQVANGNKAQSKYPAHRNPDKSNHHEEDEVSDFESSGEFRYEI